jgi:peptidoglycan hydrolase FlgJ
MSSSTLSPLNTTPATLGAQALVPHRGTGAANPEAMMQAAQDFEAMAVGQLLQPMFDTIDTSRGAFGGGSGEQAWKPMMVQEYAKQIERHGGLGLAKSIYEAMIRAQQDPGEGRPS